MLSQASRLLCLLLRAPSAAPAPALEGGDAMAAAEAAEAAPALDAIGALLLVSGAPTLADPPSLPPAAQAAAPPPMSSVARVRGAAAGLAAASCVDPLDASVQDAAGVARLAPSPAASAVGAVDAVDAARLQLARDAAALRGARSGAAQREAFDAAVRARVLTAFKEARERQAEASAALGRARAEVGDVGGCPPLLLQLLSSAMYVEEREAREAGTLARLLGELCCGDDTWMARPSARTLALALTHLAQLYSHFHHPHRNAHPRPYLLHSPTPSQPSRSHTQPSRSHSLGWADRAARRARRRRRRRPRH
jgi:hypothetical protein